MRRRVRAAFSASSARSQQCLNLHPLPQGYGSLRPADPIGVRVILSFAADLIPSLAIALA